MKFNENNGTIVLDNHKAALRELDRKVAGYQRAYDEYKAYATTTPVAKVLEAQNYRLVKSKNGFAEIRVGTGDNVSYAFNAYSGMNAILAYPHYDLKRDDHLVIFPPKMYYPNARIVHDPVSNLWWFFSWNKTGFVPSVLNKENDKLTSDQLNHRTNIINKHRELETYRVALEEGDSFGIVLYDEKMVAKWQEKLTYLESSLSDYLAAMAKKGEEDRELRSLEHLPENYQPAKELDEDATTLINLVTAKAEAKEKFSVAFSNSSGAKPTYRHVTDQTSLKEAIRSIKAASINVNVEVVAYCGK